MYNEVKVYIDDTIVKSKEKEGHIINLRKFFERIKEYRLRLNPQKCTFGVTVGKLLGFLVGDRGIEVWPIKDQIHIRNASTQKRERDKGIFGPITIHQPIHCQAHLHLWVHFQASKEEWTPCMEWRVLESLWAY